MPCEHDMCNRKYQISIHFSDSKRGLEQHGQLCDDDPDTVFKQLQGVDSQRNASIPRGFGLQSSSESAAKEKADKERQRQDDEKVQIMKKAALDKEMERQREKAEEEQKQRVIARQQEEEKRKEKEREKLENLERVKAKALIEEERKRDEATREKQLAEEEAANLRKMEREKEIENLKQLKLAQKREEERKANEIRVFEQKERKLMDFCEIVQKRIRTTRKSRALNVWIQQTIQRIAENEKKVNTGVDFFTFHLSQRQHDMI
jgi:hypothetical protein